MRGWFWLDLLATLPMDKIVAVFFNDVDVYAVDISGDITGTQKYSLNNLLRLIIFEKSGGGRHRPLPEIHPADETNWRSTTHAIVALFQKLDSLHGKDSQCGRRERTYQDFHVHLCASHLDAYFRLLSG
jgi:hypothetical protein